MKIYFIFLSELEYRLILISKNSKNVIHFIPVLNFNIYFYGVMEFSKAIHLNFCRQAYTIIETMTETKNWQIFLNKIQYVLFFYTFVVFEYFNFSHKTIHLLKLK